MEKGRGVTFCGLLARVPTATFIHPILRRLATIHSESDSFIACQTLLSVRFAFSSVRKNGRVDDGIWASKRTEAVGKAEVERVQQQYRRDGGGTGTWA